MTYIPRVDQAAVLAYRSGHLAVPAVPGAGKSTTLAHLAAQLLPQLHTGQRLLLLTYQRSAAGSLKATIRDALRDHGATRLMRGCEIRTIHGFCRQVVVEYAALLDFTTPPDVLSAPEAGRLLRRIAGQWLDAYPEIWHAFLEDERATDRWRKDILGFIPRAITAAKALLLSPAATPPPDWLLAIVVPIYALYQRELRIAQVVDYEDLVAMAFRLVSEHEGVRTRLHTKYHFILEDEAQDSDALQARLLETIAGPSGNLVRVGDINQSIQSTFTTADPREFRRFSHAVPRVPLTHASRSARPIIDLANDLVRWTIAAHPITEARDAFEPQEIQEVEGQNPPTLDPVRTISRYPTEEHELAGMARKAAELVTRDRELTVAILVRTNEMGTEVVGQLRSAHHQPDSLVQDNEQVVRVPRLFQRIFAFVQQPDQLGKLWDCLTLLAGDDHAAEARVATWRRAVGRCTPEQLLFTPPPELPELTVAERDELREGLLACRQWLGLTMRPDELVELVARDIHLEGSTLATAHKIAAELRRVVDEGGAWTRAAAAAHIQAMNPTSGFLPVETQSRGFRPRQGTITVCTYHKAKGLEWDAVFLTGLNDHYFPTDPERALFLKRTLGTPQAYEPQLRAEITALLQGETLDTTAVLHAAQVASLQERLRLLYVGITRAKRQLHLSWSLEVGRHGQEQTAQCSPIIEAIIQPASLVGAR